MYRQDGSLAHLPFHLGDRLARGFAAGALLSPAGAAEFVFGELVLDRIDERAILELNIPTGIPLVYELDDDLRPRGSRYLASDAEIAAAQHKVAAQGKASPR